MSEHLPLLQRLFPVGFLDIHEGTAEEDLAILAYAFDLCWEQRNWLLAEINPATAETLLVRFEQVFAIRRVGARTAEERQARLTIAMRRIHSFHPDAIAAYMTELISATCTVEEPGAFLTNDPNSLTNTATDVVNGQHCFFVNVDADAARAGGFDRTEAQEHLDAIKPAHTLGQLRTTGFLTNDPWSLTNRDLLGA